MGTQTEKPVGKFMYKFVSILLVVRFELNILVNALFTVKCEIKTDINYKNNLKINWLFFCFVCFEETQTKKPTGKLI